MKKTLTTVFVLGFYLLSFSQDNRDKIKTLKIAYITEKLNLTEKEAQAFWPIYNNFEDEFMRLKHQSYDKRKNVDLQNISDKDAEALLNEIRSMENKKYTLKENFINDLSKVIPAKKIILLNKVEDDFKHKMFEEFKNRRRMQQPRQ
ncbi:hypothetical protein GCM10007962_12550 [Yeosuana aromativorans]|uniref:Sensor of ECF-type sigma factor n=1 Tax=Yeosuana aromativorans TaxID=288019 RepID=A0A8J3BGJ1_9FLAO|nr:sensor of ECF-type sigma factor [Yeosuana aromativorans]GGK19896.1 hypothetical protein GCM10007962_12550 [Yeosuana aromativorans]